MQLKKNDKVTELICRQMCSVIFIKEGSYETVREHSRFNPAAYWYSFDYEGRWSLFPYIFFGKEPPIPHGTFNQSSIAIYIILLKKKSTNVAN